MAEARPVDRVPFFEFQARNRRATWRLTLALALVVGGCGFFSAVGFVVNIFLALFALVFLPAVVCLGLGALALLSPATSGLTRPLWDVGVIPLGIVGRIPSLFPGEGQAVWVIGLLLPLVCWLTARSVWLAAGVGHTLLTIGARPPVAGDLEEHQLVNVVQEMAIAAGIPPPEVRLLDARVANAAAVGTDLTGSYVVVGRRLLDEFDREETEGLLAHLIGSIGNGDLRGAAQIHSLLYVLELLIVVVLAPFARFPRRVAWRWFTYPADARVPVPGVASRAGPGADSAPHGAPAAVRRSGRRGRSRRGAGARVLRPVREHPRPDLPPAHGAPGLRLGRHGLPPPVREPAHRPPVAEPPVPRRRDRGRAHAESDRALPRAPSTSGRPGR